MPDAISAQYHSRPRFAGEQGGGCCCPAQGWRRIPVAVLDNRSMPTSTVIPELVYEDVGQAVAWLCETFAFQERWRAGNHRAQLAIGDGAIAVTEQRTG